jgi:galactokinase
MTSSVARIDPESVRQQFQQRFQSAPTLVFAPGRVNLIGDHVDYCGGLVLPMPIQQGTWVALAPRRDKQIHAESLNVDSIIDFAADELPRYPTGHWGRFITGAISVLDDLPGRLPGLNLLVGGNVPSSGLSSSASLSVALLDALTMLMNTTIDPLQLAQLAQRIEHEHIGVNCGLMDQAVIALGRPDAALLFNCADCSARSIPMHDEACAILIADTGTPRTLAGSAYNERFASMQAIAAQLNVDVLQLASVLDESHQFDDPLLQARARHVLREQQRVAQAALALEGGDYQSFGQLLQRSHASLRDDYDVSSVELNALADAFSSHSGCYGARMTGAGFGGAVVAAVKPDAIDTCCEAVSADYLAATGVETRIFRARSQGGVRRFG